MAPGLRERLGALPAAVGLPDEFLEAQREGEMGGAQEGREVGVTTGSWWVYRWKKTWPLLCCTLILGGIWIPILELESVDLWQLIDSKHM